MQEDKNEKTTCRTTKTKSRKDEMQDDKNEKSKKRHAARTTKRKFEKTTCRKTKTKQEAHGPHRSPEKLTHDYIITLIKRRKKKLYEKLLVLHLKKHESLSSKDACAKIG